MNQRHTRTCCCSVRSFTLLELLVVIAIISILAAMLSPVLGSVREKGKSAQCMNNVRQLSLLMVQYTVAFDGFFCPAYDGGSAQWDIEYPNKPGILSSAMGNVNSVESKVYSCPGMENCDPNSGGIYYTGYGYNEFLGAEASWGGKSLWGGVCIGDVRHPSSVILFADAGYEYNGQEFSSAFLRSPKKRSGVDGDLRDYGTVSARHGVCANAVFTDGHVDQVNELYDKKGNKTKRYGFLSRDNSAYDPNL